MIDDGDDEMPAEDEEMQRTSKKNSVKIEQHLFDRECWNGRSVVRNYVRTSEIAPRIHPDCIHN